MGLSYFGNISNGKMILSESGQIAYKLWYELPEHFPFLSLNEFVVMPNHIHGIVIIESPDIVGTLHAMSLKNATSLPPPQQQQQFVGTLYATSLR
jgi:REP element-mobilizing transposase RayT